MPQIKGFRGWRYNPLKISDLSGVLAPPYDVISAEERKNLYKKNPCNVIRLILGKEKAGDTGRNNKYVRAKSFLEEWMRKEVLIQDPSECIYVYRQDYREGGSLKSRTGFIAAMKLDEGSILRHENTLVAPKKDRMALLKEVGTNLSPIFGLFEDKRGAVQKILKKTLNSVPLVDVMIDGVRHRLFVENRPQVVRDICAGMKSKPMLIADGHHRLEVAFQYKKWMAEKTSGERRAASGEPWNYVMTYFSDCDHNPFTIYPTHRLIKSPIGAKNPLDVLKTRGSLRKASGLNTILSQLSAPGSDNRSGYSFGIFSKKEGFFIFQLDRRFLFFRKNNSSDNLDVAVLHKSLIEPLFQIAAIEKSDRIDFTRDAHEAVEKVNKGLWDLVLFLRPTSLAEMILISKKGLKMPQKSTYFYPKLLSGLVFHRLVEGSRS